MTSFPTSKKTFTQLVDGTTYMEGVNVNTVYDEVEALQTFLGASGNSQAKNSGLTNLFRGATISLPGLKWIDADTIEIEAKTVVMWSGNNYVIKRNTSAIQITLSSNLDTGSEAANTWYDVFLIGDGASSVYTAKFVLQGNTPSGATYYKKIMSVRNDSGSDILKFFQRNKLVMWDIPINITTTVSDNAWSGATSCVVGMPSISTMGMFGIK